jgi:hypothetical protein
VHVPRGELAAVGSDETAHVHLAARVGFLDPARAHLKPGRGHGAAFGSSQSSYPLIHRFDRGFIPSLGDEKEVLINLGGLFGLGGQGSPEGGIGNACNGDPLDVDFCF